MKQFPRKLIVSCSGLKSQLTMSQAKIPVPIFSGRRLHMPSTFSSDGNVSIGNMGTFAHRKMSTSSTVPEILVTVENSVRTITIDRQAKKNAINGPMYKCLSETIRDADGDVSTNVIVLTGKGEYYTAGNDLKDVAAILNKDYTHLVHALIDCKKPVIALINGPTIGIGVTSLGLVDAVYSSDKATFLTPFSRIGIVAEGCSTYTFPRIMGYAKASELLLFNRKITAQEAYNWGLVGAVFSDDKFQENAWARVKEIAQLPIKSIIYSKELIRGRDRAFLHELNEKEANKIIECVKSATG